MSRALAGYAESLAWVYSLQAGGMKFGLGRMKRAMKKRGQPDRGLRIVHVAGTNGKGSTCAMIERGLRSAGYKTGWFSSPHLHRYAERFRIDGRPLSDGELASRLADLRAADLNLTFFEYSVLLALEAFRDHECDVVVLEVGLGGRLDATNTIESSDLCVVTRIARDHTAILGNTVEEIAPEKGGIFRRGALAVVGADGVSATILERMARRRGMDPWVVGRDFEGSRPSGLRTVADIRVGEERYCSRLSLRGAHQVDNAAIAVASLCRLRECGFRIPESAIVSAMSQTEWPGRLEVRRRGGQEYLFDCAHNPDGCDALAAELRGMKRRKTVLLFGALGDKEHEAMLAPFDELVNGRVYAIPVMRRAPDPAVLKKVRPGHVARTVEQGLAKASALAGPGGRVVVAGSIFLVSAARASVLGLRSDPPIAL